MVRGRGRGADLSRLDSMPNAGGNGAKDHAARSCVCKRELEAAQDDSREPGRPSNRVEDKGRRSQALGGMRGGASRLMRPPSQE
jgi:hypothetical protein